MRHEHAAEGPASGNPVRPAVHAGAEAAAPAERQIVCANHGELPRHVKLSEAFFQLRAQRIADVDGLRVQRRDLLQRLRDRVGYRHGQPLREAARDFHLPRVVALPADGDVGHLRSTSVLRERKEQLLAGNVPPLKPELGSRPAMGLATC